MAEKTIVTYPLPLNDLNCIKDVLKMYPEVEKAVLFGSRAKGNNNPRSDVDIALFGKNLGAVLWKIHDQLEEDTPLPYYFDVLDYKAIKNSDLREHIDRVGKIIFKR